MEIIPNDASSLPRGFERHILHSSNHKGHWLLWTSFQNIHQTHGPGLSISSLWQTLQCRHSECPLLSLVGAELIQQSLLLLGILHSFNAEAWNYLHFHEALYLQYLGLFSVVFWSYSHDIIFVDNTSSTSPPVDWSHGIYYDSHIKPDHRNLRSNPV